MNKKEFINDTIHAKKLVNISGIQKNKSTIKPFHISSFLYINL